MQLRNEFEPIRDWAKERGIYEKVNIDTQFEKLLEEVNELKEGIENENDEEIIETPIRKINGTFVKDAN